MSGKVDVEKLRRLRDDPVLFAEAVMDWHPFPYQVTLLRDNSKRIVSCWGRQCGKTTTIAVRAIHFAFARPRTTTLIVSPSLRQSIIMFDCVLELVYGNRWLPASVVRKTRTVVELDNGSRIIALPCSVHKLRGHTADMVVVDESAFVPEEVVVNVLNPMLATTDGVLILISTPWGRDHFFYRALIDPDFSVHKVKSCECPLIPEEFLEKQREFMTKDDYLREYEAEFVEAARSYFGQDLIRSCIDADLEFIDESISVGEGTARLVGDCYMGVDLGKLRDYSAVVVVKRAEDLVKLVFLKEFPLETPYSHVIGWIVRAERRCGFRKIVVDRSGVGEAVMEEIKTQGLKNAEGQAFSAQSKAEMLTYLRIKMEQGKFKMPYSRKLCQQLNEQQYAYNKAGYLTFSHPKGSHDDMLWALALATKATRQREIKPFFTTANK
jgi:phage FluMu gp28-like protein